MLKLKHIALLSVILVAAAGSSNAGQSKFGKESDGVVVTYDDTVWEAKDLGSNPYFFCISPECGSASCIVVPSLNPDYAQWPTEIGADSLASLGNVLLNHEKDGGHSEAEIVEPVKQVTIGKHEALSISIRTKSGGPWLSTRYMIKGTSDTHMVPCEGDEASMTAMKGQIETLISGMEFVQK